MKKTTRDIDLERIDEGRQHAQTEEGNRRREATLVAIYEQIKDPVLEGMRLELIDVMKFIEYSASENRQMNVIKGHAQLEKLQNKIKLYTSTPDFKKNIARKIASQVGEREAIEFFNKS